MLAQDQIDRNKTLSEAFKDITDSHKDNRQINGTKLNSPQNGKGVEIQPDGSIFEGKFVAGKRNGYGKFTKKDEYQYKGMFQNNKFHGFGTFTNYGVNDSDFQYIMYTGDWFKGEMHGFGTV